MAFVFASDCRDLQYPGETICGGISDVALDRLNTAEFEKLGRFAVQQHNKTQNTLLEFGRVVKAKQQLVAGVLYFLTLEAVDGGKNKIYEAQVWDQSWTNFQHFQQLQDFKEVHDNPIMPSASGLGINHGN